MTPKGQPPLEGVEESPALEQAQPLPLGMAPSEEIANEIMKSPRGTGVCKEKTQKGDHDQQVTQDQQVVDAQSEEEEQGGLLPSTSSSMQSQVFTQVSEETPPTLTPIPNQTRMCSTQSSDETTPKTPGKKLKAPKRKNKGQSGQPSDKKQIQLPV